MDRKNIDSDHLTITGAHRNREVSVDIRDDVEIVVTRAFGPRGDNLVGIRDVKFDGHPAVTLGVRVGGREGEVHLSPIHGDRRKAGLIDIEPGQRCELFCPVSGELLDTAGPDSESEGPRYYALYLTPKLSAGSAVVVSDTWDHYDSRIIDEFELISEWAGKV